MLAVFVEGTRHQAQMDLADLTYVYEHPLWKASRRWIELNREWLGANPGHCLAKGFRDRLNRALQFLRLMERGVVPSESPPRRSAQLAYHVRREAMERKKAVAQAAFHQPGSAMPTPPRRACG